MKKLYRFAMFGRKSAGKTCFLAALSLKRIAHPGGLTATWVPEAPEADSKDPVIKEAYRRGKEALELARTEIGQGKNPPPSKLKIHRYRFDFGSAADKRMFSEELIDYSGELIDESTTRQEMAKSLRSLLCAVDGLIVLAEAPQPGHESDRLCDEFERLQQALALLSAEREQGKRDTAPRVPVALVMNKWDRRRCEGTKPADLGLQVAEFLNSSPEPAHKSLENYLYSAVAEGCFKTFAGSAFGQARLVNEIDAKTGASAEVECPTPSRPLPSFGMEDAFCWAAKTRDTIDLQDYEEKAERLAWASAFPSFFANAFNPFAANKVRSQGAQLASRFPKHSEQRQRAAGLAKKALRVTALRALSLGVFVFGAILASEGAYDTWQMRHTHAELARTDLTEAQLIRPKNSLDAYVKAPDYRHLIARAIYPRGEARQELQRLRERREDVLWEAVRAKEADVLEQIAPANYYLAQYPNGRFVVEATQIIHHGDVVRQQRLREQQRNEIDSYLTSLDAKTKQLAKSPELSKKDVQQLANDLDAIPHSDDIRTEAQRQLIVDLGVARGALYNRVEREENEKGFFSYLKNLEIVSAAGLAEKLGKDPKYTDAMMETVRSTFATLATQRNWTEIRSKCSDINKAWRTKKLLSPQEKDELTRWINMCNRGEDRDLYALVRKFKNADRCRDYLESQIPSECRTMTPEVEEYKKHLEAIGGVLPLKIELTSIYVGKHDGYARNGIGCKVRINDRRHYEGGGLQWAAESIQPIPPEKGRSTDESTYDSSLKDDVKVEITITGTTRGGDKEDLGSIIWVNPMRDLRDTEIVLPVTKYCKTSCKAKLKIFGGIPDEPLLPSYRESQ